MQTSPPKALAQATIKSLEDFFKIPAPTESVDSFSAFLEISKAHGGIPMPDMPAPFKVQKRTDDDRLHNHQYIVHVAWFRGENGQEDAFTAIIHEPAEDYTVYADSSDPEFPGWLTHRLTDLTGYIKAAEKEKARTACH